MSLSTLALVFSALLPISFANAQEASSSAEVPATSRAESPNIHRGNVQVGGSLAVGYNEYAAATVDVAPIAEYFFLDRLSLGGTVQAYLSGENQETGIGPSFSYHFAAGENWSTSLGGGAIFYKAHRTDQYGAYDTNFATAFAKLGANFFIVPSVAFGPTLRYERLFTDKQYNGKTFDTARLLIQLSVYL